VDDWLFELHDGERAEPAGPGNAEPTGPGNARPIGLGPSGPGYTVPADYAVPASPGHAMPASYVRAVPAGPGYAMQASPGRAVPAAGSARPEALAGPVAPAVPAAPAIPARAAPPATPPGHAAPAAPAGPAGAAARAVIGDQLRIPIMWCEMGSCVSWHADPAALGEADARARAIGAGWRLDAFGRLACPRCQQTDPGFWSARPVAVRDRHAATGTPAPDPAVPRNSSADRAALRTSRDPGRAARCYPPASRAELEWHHDSPAGGPMPAGRYAGDPAGTSRSRLAVLNVARAWRSRGGRQAAPRPASEHGDDLMIAGRAHAGSAGVTTLGGRRW
jgi:hypothetical protein